MGLYYVRTADNDYRLVVNATCPWNARYKATKFVREEYDVKIEVQEWRAELCSDDVVVE